MARAKKKQTPLSGAQLVKNHDDRRRDNGQVPVLVRVWVQDGNQNEARKRMRGAVEHMIVGPDEVF